MRNFRSLLDHWKRRGWQDTTKVTSSGKKGRSFDSRQTLENYVIGIINYVKMTRGHDDRIVLKLEADIFAIINRSERN